MAQVRNVDSSSASFTSILAKCQPLPFVSHYLFILYKQLKYNQMIDSISDILFIFERNKQRRTDGRQRRFELLTLAGLSASLIYFYSNKSKESERIESLAKSDIEGYLLELIRNWFVRPG